MKDKSLTSLKKQEETIWLREVDATALQSSLQDLDTAYRNFFRRVKNGEKPGYPKFKSKRNYRQSYKSKCVGSNIKVLEGAVQLPKPGKVKCRISKQVEGRILSATVSQTPSGKYFVCAKVGLSVMRCFSRPRYQCRKDHFERRTAPAGVWLDVGQMPVILFCA